MRRRRWNGRRLDLHVGCSISELLGAIRDSLVPSGPSSQDAQPDRAASEVWKWLVQRSDVSVGHGRELNHLSLAELLSLPQYGLPASDRPQGRGAKKASKHVTGSPNSSQEDVIRIYTSEATMWEAISGHAVDHKRIPRSEWLLLLGIASSKSNGILQGDLGRLVNQDKRSVPKRTDALVKKGYIVKRTTLVRGTKTSKIWLRSFAPSLPREGDPADETEAAMNLSRQTLAENLHPVPWHIRWTGQDIDYKALATTIMTIVKEWNVIRVRDLKGKLGILGLRWQMKIVSKTCRFLNARGAIQFVAAQLEGRVFKDCVKFGRDMTAEDWGVYLSTGQHPGKPSRGSEHLASDQEDGNEQLDLKRANDGRLSMCPPWTLDMPLPQAIARTVQSLGDRGLSNPDIYALTLGANFNRFLSSMTASLSTPDLQPPHLRHLQMRSERTRTGKVASYLFFLPTRAAAPHQPDTAAVPETAETSGSPGELYGFLPAVAVPTFNSSSLAVICGLRKPRKPGKKRSEQTGVDGKDEGQQQAEPEARVTEASRPNPPEDQRRRLRRPSRLVTLKIQQETLRAATVERTPSPQPLRSSATRPRGPSLETPGEAAPVESAERDEPESSAERDASPSPRPARGSLRRGGTLGRGRGRRPSSARSGDLPSPRPWKCEKCGGSWKNDVGLKYHLEKSRTRCNPSYTSPDFGATRKGKPRRFLRPMATSLSDVVGSRSPARSGTRCPDRNGDSTSRLVAPCHQRDGQWAEQRGHADETPPRGMEQTASTWPGFSPTGTDQGGGRSSPQRANPGVLLEDDSTAARPILALDGPRCSDSPASRPPKEESTADSTRSSVQGADVSDAAPGSLAVMAVDQGWVATAQGETSEPCRSSSAVRSRPNDAGDAGKTNGKQRPRERICSFIDAILDEHGGAVLGGKSLWHAFTAAWQNRLPDMPLPTDRACQAALNSMIRKESVTEHWHAFRDRKGLFAKCQLILRPGIDAFSPESLCLIDQAKAAPSPPVESSPMETADDAEPQAKKARAPRGRRILLKEVAVLDAPVYAAQVAAKRAAEAATGSPHGRKRAKYSARAKRGKGDDFATSPSIKFASELADGEESSLALPFVQPAAPICFLDPNTCLGDELVSGAPPLPIDPRLTQREEHEPALEQQPQQPVHYVFDSVVPIIGRSGSWPVLEDDEFDRLGTSFTLCGWIPNKKWLRWTAFALEIDKRYEARQARSTPSSLASAPYDRFVDRLRACEEVEALWKTDFVHTAPGAAGPHNIFITFVSRDGERPSNPFSDLSWPAEGQLTSTSAHGQLSALDSDELSSTDSGSRPDRRVSTRLGRRTIRFADDVAARQTKIKRVERKARALTALPTSGESTADAAAAVADPAELMAAFVAVRTLLGGAEKAVDWGLLVKLYPKLGLRRLRKFWADARKEASAYISNFTRVFQERVVTALDDEELPMIDFDNVLDYDWDNLIQWTVQLPRQEGFQLPFSRDVFAEKYSLEDVKATSEDWREKYFHGVTSVFTRYELVSSEPGAVTVAEASQGLEESHNVDDLTVARSWIKSLCCTADTAYSAEQVKGKFLELAPRDGRRRAELLKEAAAQLAQQRVICRKDKSPARGRPYRLNESYVSTLARMAQSAKYDEAAAFKGELDAAFGRREAMPVPYTLNDGAMMALTNLSAAGKIRLVPVDVPSIPFGFEPGNYESRKTPKSKYHFALEAVPTAAYEHNADIEVLRAVAREGPPRGGARGETPQWIDILGKSNVQQWSEVLGAFCFAFATRGSMTIEGICSALDPLLDKFEAHLIVAWGRRTGVLTDLIESAGTTVGDWWWLAVPWLRRPGGDAGPIGA